MMEKDGWKMYNVNDLVELLGGEITEVVVGNQHSPVNIKVGVGGILNIWVKKETSK